MNAPKFIKIMGISILVPLSCFTTGTWASKPGSSSSVDPQLTPTGSQWRAEFANDYEVVGPFPQEAREQHFLNPGYPLGSKIVFPLNHSQSFPSHLADNGYVYWQNGSRASHLEPTDSVRYSISFPEIRWEGIRATEGWAGLQHHALLHTKIKLVPPQSWYQSVESSPTYIALSASQCSYVTVFDSRLTSGIPQWHTCNIYAYSDAPAIRIPFPHGLDSHKSTSNGRTTRGSDSMGASAIELDVLISLDYEIRLFGDPTVAANTTTPTIISDLQASVEVEPSGHYFDDEMFQAGQEPDEQVQSSLLTPSSAQSRPCLQVGDVGTHVVPHFVGGWAYGEAVGIEITSCSRDFWEVDHAVIVNDGDPSDFLTLTLSDPVPIAPGQTRLASFTLTQTKMLSETVSSLTIELHIYQGSLHVRRYPHRIQTSIQVVNHQSLSKLVDGAQGALLTYHSVSGAPASAVVIPPSSEAQQAITSDTRILLAMHGAGVMHTSPFWLSALPRPEHTWLLVVQGLTPWGLDWREASRADVCAALRALVLELVGIWRVDDYCTTHDSIQEVRRGRNPEPRAIPVIAIGHSNGGQGSLQLASLFPDCIPALVPAAGYTSARLYISTQLSRGSLFADAALQGVMRASLQGQDGDLVAGNLVLNRVHLVHGGDDENVPVWHSRERMALVKNWSPSADVNMTEVPGRPHFWDTVFKDEPVSGIIKELVASPRAIPNDAKHEFTFTVVWPSESGSMHGWRVRELTIPGRLSRIRVSGDKIKTTNVHGISIELSKAVLSPGSTISIDDQIIEIPQVPNFWLRRDDCMQWKSVTPFSPFRSGPLTSILISTKPIAIIIPLHSAPYYRGLALRIAHNLYTYLKLDCTILRDDEVLGTSGFEDQSVVVIGGFHNKYGLDVRDSPFQVYSDKVISISGVEYSEPGTAALSLHQRHLYIDAVDEAGYERALRMFPLRTGVPGPEWMIVGEECDQRGYGGVLAAGFWNRSGGVSESMSYFS